MARKDNRKVMTITMPDDVKKKLEQIATDERRSKSQMIHYLIERYYDKNKWHAKSILEAPNITIVNLHVIDFFAIFDIIKETKINLNMWIGNY